MREREECDFGLQWFALNMADTLLQSSPRRGNNGHHLAIERREGEDCWGLNALDTAITALSGLDRRGGSRGPRRMGASARAKISAAQKARWAKAKGHKGHKVVPIKA